MTAAAAPQPAVRPSAVIAMTACKVIGLISPSLIPLLIPALIKSYGLTAGGAGLMVSYQMMSLAGAGFLVSLMVQKIDRRLGAAAALCVILAGNLACLFAAGVPALIAGRMIVGAGEGALTAITIAAASRSAIPERIFAMFALAIGLFGAGLLYVLPRLIAAYGAGGVFIAMIALTLAAFPTLIWFPPRPAAGKSTEAPGLLFNLGAPAALTLMSATIFAVGTGAITSYVGVIGHQIGVSTADIGKMLSLGSVLSIVTPLSVVLLAGRLGLARPMIAGAILVTGITLAIGNAGSASFYFLAGALFNPTVLFLSPYQYGLMATLDPKGRIGAAGPTFIKIGFAAGAASGGFVLDHASRGPLSVFAAAWVAAGMTTYCIMAARADRIVRTAALVPAE